MSGDPTKSALKVVKTGEVGIGGTPNYSGRIQNGDPNPALSHTLAYGLGPRWGEWEEISRTDPDISSALAFVVAPIRDAWIDVKPAVHPAIPPEEAQKHADFVKYNLTDALETRWVEFIAQAVKGALGSGFALHEKVYGICRHPLLPGGVGYCVRRLAERLPSTVQQDGWREAANEHGDVDLVAVIQQGQKYEGTRQIWTSNVALPADKVLLTTWDRSANNYAGYSAFRPVYYLAKIRQALARIFAIGAEREALGVPTASGTSELNDLQYKKLAEDLQGLTYHESASMVLPPNWKLEFLTSPQANKAHILEAYTTLGTVILRQVSAQMLAIGTTDNTGNRSLGEMHTGVSTSFLNGVISMLEGVVNGSRAYNGLGRAIVAPNWGEQPAYPVITFGLKKGELDVPRKVDAISKAVAGGIIRITDADEIAMREMVGLPTEIMVPRTEADEAPEAEGADGAPDAEGGESEGEKPADAKPSAPAPKMHRFSAVADFSPSRPLRDSEKVLSLNELASYIGFAGQPGAAVKSFEARVRPVVAEMLVKALPEITAAMEDGDPSEVADINLDTARLTQVVEKYLIEVEAEGYRQAKNERARGSAKEILTDRADGLPGIKPVSFAADGGGTLKRAQTGVSVRRITARLKEAIEQEAIEVIRTDGDPTEVVGNVLNRSLDSAAFRGEASGITTRAFNIGREAFAEQYGSQVDSMEYSAILDDGTCGPCAALDGESFEFQSEEHIANTPPNRNCEGLGRCRCVLITKWKAES